MHKINKHKKNKDFILQWKTVNNNMNAIKYSIMSNNTTDTQVLIKIHAS